jgi:beta-phosphoglucomutase-like phosphatase (HAD superfamily)
MLPCIPKAIIFDVDGTLYDQRKLRLCMVREMFTCVLREPGPIAELIILRHFRPMRGKHANEATTHLEGHQYLWAAQAARLSPEKVQEVVQEWMVKRPLAYLRSCGYPGAQALFFQYRRQCILLGVFSDYPARDKLRALGLTAQFVVSAACGEVNRLKPKHAGLLVAAEKLGVVAAECLFIGDQEAKEGECAWRAGMPSLILASRPKNHQLRELTTWLKDVNQS